MSIVLSNVSKRFGDHLVVNQANLEVEKGELFVLLGESGSGKSTILRMIAGLTLPDSGSIQLNGVDVTFLPSQVRKTGFVFQNYSIFRHMTVAENIEFGLRIRNVPSEERKQRHEELLDLVGLAGLGSRYSDQLSGGQRQRVALARALAYNPEVLLLDEPFGALDVKIRAQLRASLKEIQDKLVVTTILVTHDQEEAFELADRIGIIDKGNILEIGNPEELYQRPKNEFVATFIGGGNVLVGRVVDGQIQMGPLSLPFPDDAPSHEEGSPVRILFRPETVQLQKHVGALEKERKSFVQGQITERIFAGSQQRIRIEVESIQGIRPLIPAALNRKNLTVIEAIQPNLPGGDQFATGEQVWVGVKDYRVLEPAGFKVLICHNPSRNEEAPLDFGCRLATSARGPTTILAVAEANSSLDEVRGSVKILQPPQFAHLSNLSTKVRQGEVSSEIIFEAQEGHYELVVLGRQEKASGLAGSGLGSIARKILSQGAIPVLLVEESRPKIERVLLCTAAGEPGKAVVLFGGRIARRTGARATILHILNPKSSPFDQRRIERHLRQVQSSLEARGVPGEILMKEGIPPIEGILSEAESGDYDLIVIGASLLPHPHQFRWVDTASRVIHGTTRPVIVVPMLPA